MCSIEDRVQRGDGVVAAGCDGLGDLIDHFQLGVTLANLVVVFLELRGHLVEGARHVSQFVVGAQVDGRVEVPVRQRHGALLEPPHGTVEGEDHGQQREQDAGDSATDQDRPHSHASLLLQKGEPFAVDHCLDNADDPGFPSYGIDDRRIIPIVGAELVAVLDLDRLVLRIGEGRHVLGRRIKKRIAHAGSVTVHLVVEPVAFALINANPVHTARVPRSN